MCHAQWRSSLCTILSAVLCLASGLGSQHRCGDVLVIGPQDLSRRLGQRATSDAWSLGASWRGVCEDACAWLRPTLLGEQGRRTGSQGSADRGVFRQDL